MTLTKRETPRRDDPIQTGLGLQAPRRENVLAALRKLWDETIVPNWGDAADWLELTTRRFAGSSCGRPRAGCWRGRTKRGLPR